MAKAPQSKLKEYRQPDAWQRFWNDDAEFTRSEMEKAYTEFALGLEDQRDLGMRVAEDVTTKGTVLRYLLGRAANEAAGATHEYLETDLTTKEGIERARALQNQALRYRELIEWLEEAITMGTDAAHQLAQIHEEEREYSSDDAGEQTLDVGEMNGIPAV